MLSFATEFPVRHTGPQAFVAAVRRWIEGSPHTTFNASSFSEMPADGRWTAGTAAERLEAMLASGGESATAAFKHTALNGGIEWTTTVVYSKAPEDDWVSIRTDRQSSQPQISLPSAKKPLIVKTILSELGGGLDSELYVSDQPFYLAPNDLGMATRLLNADADNYLPIVYVSCAFDGSLPINPVPLANSLGGMAHVIVEPDRSFSRLLQEGALSRNVYGGRVGVYWPNGERYTYFLNDETPSEFEVRRLIVSRIRAALLNRRPLARCTWSRAEAEVARAVFERLRQTGSEDVSEYVDAFDTEINAKNRQLEDAEAEISRLRSRLRAADQVGGASSLALPSGAEQEFFNGEFAEVVGEALVASSVSAQDGSRRQHVLSAFASAIPSQIGLKERREALKRLLRDYKSMDRETRKGLETLGFVITEDGKHYKLVYMQDDRYTFPIAKTGSDNRGGLNSVSDIGKRVF